MNIELFIENIRIELFDDENIFYRGKIIDSQNLNSIFNDFVNTFSLPSTPKTDRVFKYWFELGVNNGFNPNKRVDGFIQFNSIPLKVGKVQLESIQEENGRITSYSITMYGNLTSLNDTFQGKKLSDLNNLSDYNFAYSKLNLQAGVQFPALMTLNKGFNEESDIVFPMIISRDGEVQYNTSVIGDTSDISLPEGRLSVKDLRPSIRQSVLIDAIQEQFGLTFEGAFLNTASFRNSFLWLNGNEDFEEINTWDPAPLGNNGTYTFDNGDVDVIDNEIIVNRDIVNLESLGSLVVGEMYDYAVRYEFTIRPNVTDVEYSFRLVDTVTGEPLQRGPDATGNSTWAYLDRFWFVFEENNRSFGNKYRLEITSQGEIDFDYDLSIQTDIYTQSTTVQNLTRYTETNNLTTVIGGFDVATNLPEMTITDYLTSLIKQYKLVVRPITDKIFLFDNIQTYFQDGNLIDFTKYIDNAESTEAIRYPNFKEINFNFLERDNVLQNNFNEKFGRYVGDSLREYDVDTKETADVSIGFETLIFTRLDNTGDAEEFSNFNLALLQNEDAEAEWTKNPVIHYYNGVTDISNNAGDPPIVFDFLSETADPANANTFSASTITLCDNSDSEVFTQVNNTFDYSDSTINGWHSRPITENLYNNYYKPWIDVIYAPDTRVINFIAKDVPFGIISNLDLNTAIVIDNNKYNIDEFNINLLTSEVEFRLFPSNLNSFILGPLDTFDSYNYFNAGGNWDSVNVQSTEPIVVNQSTAPSWLIVEPRTLSPGRYEVSYYVAYNPSTSTRSATFTITSGNLTKTVYAIQRQA